MYRLTVIQNQTVIEIPFEKGQILDEVLIRAGLSVPHPCGGKGICKKCKVQVRGEISPPDKLETKAGCRLSCRTVLLGDATVTIDDTGHGMQIENVPHADVLSRRPMSGRYGAAVDVGTTTVALRVYDLKEGQVVSQSAALNPQRSFSADIMGRIDAALRGEGDLLKKAIIDCIEKLITEATAGREIKLDALVISGNTTMLYLLCGRDPSSLATSPFIADTLFDVETEILGIPTYLPPCIGAFVGADLTSALLASGVLGKDGTYLLCDVGTNGEIALLRDGKLIVTSTAAGPAFEGVGISSGCMGVLGAIDRVSAVGGRLLYSTIGGMPPIGICGSGLIDAVASALSLELIDEAGTMEDEEIDLGGVTLIQEDIRSLQLAKAAIAAGIETLLDEAKISADEIDECIIAGGFGSHIDPKSAAAIGLFKKTLTNRIRTIGNGSLDGAAELLVDVDKRDILRKIADEATLVNLGGNPKFSTYYIENMSFE